MSHDVYIGGGPTATAMLRQHVRALVRARHDGRWSSDDGVPRITVVERSGRFGPGLPFGDGALDCHLVNMEADTVSIDPAEPTDFIDWMARHRDRLEARFPGSDLGPRGFPPRRVVGQYLSERFADAERLAARHDIRVERRVAEAIEVIDDGRAVTLSLADGSRLRASRALLATGHWNASPPAEWAELAATLDTGGGYADPWPADRLLARIPRGVTVGVLGSSLTALDVALTLVDDGGRFVETPAGLTFEADADCRTVVLWSRSGLIPRVRSAHDVDAEIRSTFTKSILPELTDGGRRAPSLDEVLARFRSSLQRVFRGREGVPDPDPAFDRWWRDAFDPMGEGQGSSRDHASRLAIDLASAQAPSDRWNRTHHAVRAAYSVFARVFPLLEAADQRRFRQQVFRQFNAHAGAMPIANARKLLALLRSGRVRIVGHLDRVSVDHRRRFVFQARNARGGEQRLATPWVVQAMGQPRDDLAGCPILARAVDHGLCRMYRAGGLEVEYDSSRVLDRAGRPSPRLHAVGVMTGGQRIGSSALVASGKFTGRVVDRWLRELDR